MAETSCHPLCSLVHVRSSCQVGLIVLAAADSRSAYALIAAVVPAKPDDPAAAILASSFSTAADDAGAHPARHGVEFIKIELH